MYQNVDYWYSTENGDHIPVVNNDNKIIENKNTQVEFKPLNNRKELTSYVKEQTNIDLEELATEKQTHPRSYLNINGENLNPSEIRSIKEILQKYGHNTYMENNGVYDYAIMYEKQK